jgi:GNAT superfamily N-acetyltransferase
MNIVIRDATEADIPHIFDVRTSVRENSLTMAQMAGLGITPDAIAVALGQQPCIWVAVHDGVVIGFSMSDVREGCVFAAFVRPEWEGKGIGRQLIEKAEDFLFAHHACIWLNTDGASRAAKVYERLGWTPVAKLANGEIRFEKRRLPELP